jgi:hypothetical protein
MQTTVPDALLFSRHPRPSQPPLVVASKLLEKDKPSKTRPSSLMNPLPVPVLQILCLCMKRGGGAVARIILYNRGGRNNNRLWAHVGESVLDGESSADFGKSRQHLEEVFSRSRRQATAIHTGMPGELCVLKTRFKRRTKKCRLGGEPKNRIADGTRELQMQGRRTAITPLRSQNH